MKKDNCTINHSSSFNTCVYVACKNLTRFKHFDIENYEVNSIFSDRSGNRSCQSFSLEDTDKHISHFCCSFYKYYLFSCNEDSHWNGNFFYTRKALFILETGFQKSSALPTRVSSTTNLFGILPVINAYRSYDCRHRAGLNVTYRIQVYYFSLSRVVYQM